MRMAPAGAEWPAERETDRTNPNYREEIQMRTDRNKWMVITVAATALWASGGSISAQASTSPRETSLFSAGSTDSSQESASLYSGSSQRCTKWLSRSSPGSEGATQGASTP